MKLIKSVLILPSYIYDLITSIRNIFFDLKIFKSKVYDESIISVGNLSTGGTGKSVLVDYLICLFEDIYEISILSRGYNRKSKGVLEVTSASAAREVGDEPKMLFSKHPSSRIVVCESRKEGMDFLLNNKKENSIYLLDDAFQHRWVIPGLSILLTTYKTPFYDDHILPYGNLRENIKGVRRADVIIVTKCPKNIDLKEKNKIIKKIDLLKNQKIFFSFLNYSNEVFSENKKISILELKNKKFLLVTGVADPDPLVMHLKFLNLTFDFMKFSDHHNFKNKDVVKIKKLGHENLILTTEKDYVRLSPLIKNIPIFYIPIKICFEKSEKNKFDILIKDFLLGK